MPAASETGSPWAPHRSSLATNSRRRAARLLEGLASGPIQNREKWCALTSEKAVGPSEVRPT